MWKPKMNKCMIVDSPKDIKRKFECACAGHMLEIEYTTDGDVGISIYDIVGKTKKLKKPRLTADVLLWGKEAKNFKKFTNKFK